MNDGRKRTKRMPLGTWFWMPFFERKVQSILSKLQKAEGEDYALWAYCEIACVVIARDSKSFKLCAKESLGTPISSNGTGRGAFFESLFRSTKLESSRLDFAKLFLEVEKCNKIIWTNPARRHRIAAYSEAKSPHAFAEKYRLGKISKSVKNAQDSFVYDLWSRFCAPPEIDLDKPIGWKYLNFSESSWTAKNAGVFAEAERSRRLAVLKLLAGNFFFCPAVHSHEILNKYGKLQVL